MPRPYKRSRRSRRRPQEGVELNMAAMLDMAFQLLAFFILTFQPSEIETQIAMRTPKDESISRGASAAAEEPAAVSDLESIDLPLKVGVYATPEGGIDRVVLGAKEYRAASEEELYPAVRAAVGQIVSGVGADGIQMLVAGTLKYEHLMRILDICANQRLPSGERLTKVSLSTMEAGEQ